MADPTVKQRSMFAAMGVAMPDGSHTIRGGSFAPDDLQKAIDAVKSMNDDDPKAVNARKHIVKRAKTVNLSGKVPPNWNPDGSLKHSELAMADPTAAQRKVFAKLHLSMPDGSYYIRNGPQGVTDLDNAIKAVGRGSEDDGGHDAIRSHIMRRATALKLSDRIPDTWNPDGSLKHSQEELVLKHFGTRGMKWGIRKGAMVAPASGLSSGSSKPSSLPGRPGASGPSKPRGLPGHLGASGPSAGSSKTGLGGKKSGVLNFRKGNKVGSVTSADASNAKALHATVGKHGTKALSNEDLQKLVTRMNLEQQYNRLSSDSTHAGRDVLGKLLSNVAKQQAQSFASQYAAKGIESAIKTSIKIHNTRSAAAA